MGHSPRPFAGLRRKGRGDDEGGGVREPRDPPPPSGEDGAAVDPEADDT